MVQTNCVKPKIIAIVGPTASGKTSLGVEIAKAVNGEIISADSMQIYKHMDIGTAKVTNEEMSGIPHHLIDIVDPTERYSVALWVQDAKEKIKDIISRGKTPIIVGGTGLYVTSLIKGYTFYDVDENTTLRGEYRQKLEIMGADALYNELTRKAPDLAKTIDPHKTKAIIRALELVESGADLNKSTTGEDYNCLLIGLELDRVELYDRINTRVDKMMKDGLLEEFNNLVVNHGLKKEHQSAGAIGYKELFPLLHGEVSEEQTIELIKQHSRNYAKRQLTWMRKMDGIIWLSPKTQRTEIIEKVKNFLR